MTKCNKAAEKKLPNWKCKWKKLEHSENVHLEEKKLQTSENSDKLVEKVTKSHKPVKNKLVS